jgi:hypothetical protein
MSYESKFAKPLPETDFAARFEAMKAKAKDCGIKILQDGVRPRAATPPAKRERMERQQQCREARIQHPASSIQERPTARVPYPEHDLPEDEGAGVGSQELEASIEQPESPVCVNVGQAVESAFEKLPAVANGLSHKERQREWVGQGKGDGDNERMMELLCQGFDLFDATRSARGKWISKQDFIFEHKILTPNSRASELRGSETHPGHPLVNEYRLEIDQCSDEEITGQSGSCYSVCFVEHSLRLARERAAKEKGQATFGE